MDQPQKIRVQTAQPFSACLEELAEQFLDEIRNGKKLEIQEYAARYPEHAAQLLKLLPILLELEGYGAHADRVEVNGAGAPYSTGNSERNLQEEELPELTGTDFRLLRKLGSGGMGTVYEALQLSLDRRVAVKLLSAHFLDEPYYRELFENESRLAAMLRHPNIVQIFSAEKTHGFCCFAMELIEGKPLNVCEFHSLREIAEIGLQAAQALAYAHRCGIIHRDIKPANLLLTPSGQLHVSDFGIACLLQEQTEIIETGSPSGTLRFMAPERFLHGVNSFSCDQYSLGATLFELISGKPLFHAGSYSELRRQMENGDIPLLECAEQDLAAIIRKSTRFSPEERYAGMDEMAADLQRFLNHEPVNAVRSSKRHRLFLWLKRKPAQAVLSAFSLFCVFALAAALLIGYLRTAKALKLAEENAAIAQNTLSRIFSHVGNQMPTANSAVLLAELIPYWEEIAQKQNMEKSQTEEALLLLGKCALQTGEYRQAEFAFRRLTALHPDNQALFFLSQSLRKQERTDEANRLCREILAQTDIEDAPRELLTAVCAWQTMPGTIAEHEKSQALMFLRKLLTLDPKNPEYRFRAAVFLTRNPQLSNTELPGGIGSDALKIFEDLASEFPERPEYACALVRHMTQHLKHLRKKETSRTDENISSSRRVADELLGRFPTVPEIITLFVDFEIALIDHFRKKGELNTARRETERLTGILDILSLSPDTPDTVRECLLSFQLERLERLIRDGRTKEEEELRGTIQLEFERYHGPQKEKLQEQLRSSNGSRRK